MQASHSGRFGSRLKKAYCVEASGLLKDISGIRLCDKLEARICVCTK